MKAPQFSGVRKAVVPVAGAGTRLFPATKSQPKEMLPVGRKPVVQYVIEELLAAGVRQFLLVTGPKKTAIENHFDQDVELSGLLQRSTDLDASDLAIADGVPGIFYTRQSVPTGVADAVGLAREFVGDEHFLVAFGDTILRAPGLLPRMLETHAAAGASCTVAVEEVPPEDAYRYGIVHPQPVSGGIAVGGLVEKPQPGRAPSNLAIVPRYVFSPKIFDAIEATRPGLGGERWLTDSIASLLRDAAPVRAVPLAAGERRYDIGNFESYFKAFIDFAADDARYGAAIRQYLSQRGQDL